MKNHEKNILIIAGEPSGDVRGAELIGELRKLVPSLSFWGIGGDRMAGEGVDLVEHVRELSIVGAWEALKKLAKIRAQYKMIITAVGERKPLAAILIDYPGFNLMVAKELHSRGIPVVYYIIPQVWAWGKGRTRSIKKYVDKPVVLFNFEKKFLKDFGIDAEFAGHPLMDKIPADLAAGNENGPLNVALLPGSRKHEVTSLFPVMLDAAELILEKRKDAVFTIAESSNVASALYDKPLSDHPRLKISRIKDNTISALSKADFVIVASGTATLETAIMERPMIIIYKAAPITFILYKLVSDVRYLGLVNIIAGKEVVPELLQHNATPEKIARTMFGILEDRTALSEMTNNLKIVKSALGEKGASKRAAEAVKRFLEEKELL